MMTQTPVIERIFPIEPVESSLGKADYEYEPDIQFLIQPLMVRYIEAKVTHALLENVASEQAARILAMQNATDSADRLKHELELSYHKQRQASITQEISEICGGADAIS
jgi:F-type H+-transporting ATPase subunit gamma